MSIEAWVTAPDGSGKVVLDRSEASPFRNFAVSRTRGAEPGTGSLQHHLDNALIAATPGLLADGNLVWMRYRSRTMVWVIEERTAVLDDSEHATDWVLVTGRGVKQLIGDRLVFPPAFGSGANLDPATWGKGNQWRRFTNRAAGELLWDLISDSNPRFATQLVRGTIETTGADGWTQDFRFDNQLDVVADVVATYGDVDMDGLTFSYLNAPGVDRRAEVIFEEGADLLKVERTTSDRDTVTWAVAEGVGEGVTAKLAVAEDPTPARRREGYVDAKDAGNVPLVQLRADAAIAELKKADAIAIDVEETRFRVFEDFDLHDTVRAIAPSRGIDAAAVIVGIYLAEEGDERVRVSLDVNTPRQELLLRLEEGAKSIGHSVGVRNRMPQGQLVPFSFSGADVFDDTDTMDVFLAVPDRMYITIEVSARIRFREFFAAAKSASSGGGSTSGASSASSSGASSSSTSDATGTHNHYLGIFSSSTPGVYTKRKMVGFDSGGSNWLFNLETESAIDYYTSNTQGSHAHGIAHTHGIPHTHTTPDHTHALVYGVFKETYPVSHSVTLKVYELVTGAWTLRTTTSGLTGDFETVDLTQWIDGPGDWRLELKSAGGQPNGGRLGCDVYGFVLGAIQSE